MTVNVMTGFGALGNGTADDAPAIQAAIATRDDVYLPTPPVKYKLASNNLSFARPGQKMFGDGRLRSMFLVASPVPGNGIIETSTGDAGPQLYDFGLSFTQPDTNIRVNLTTYAPAIYARNTPRISIDRVYIERATVGIDMQRCGDTVIRDFECSAFDKHIAVDEFYDPINIDRAMLGAWGVTGNQTQIIFDAATIGVHAGRVDGLKILGSTIGCGTALRGVHAASGTVSAQIGGDTGFEIGGIVLDGGFVTFTGGYFSPASGAYQAIKQTGGDITLSGCRMNGAVSSTLPMVDVSAGAGFTWTGGTVFAGSQDRSVVKSRDAGTVINLSTITVFRDPNVAYVQPTFWKAAGVANIVGTIVGNGFGGGSCRVIQVDTDDYDCVMANTLHGGTVSFPGSPVKGVYGPNGH